MPRPYFSYSGEQLRAVFAEAEGDLALLRELRKELTHRTTPSMRKLREEVEARISEGARRSTVPPPMESAGPLFEGAARSARPGDTIVEPLVAEYQEDEQAEKDEDEEETGVAEQGQRGAGSPPQEGADDSTLPPDDRRRPKRYSLIQPVGVSGRPTKFVPKLRRDIDLGVPSGASHASRFSVALTALIEEMKAKGTGSRSFQLTDGAAVNLGTESFGYTFAFVEAAEIFEDAEVQVLLGTRRCVGTVVSIASGRITLALDVNLGPSIRSCVLRVDSTALLVALKDRLDQIEATTLTLNTALADRVLTGMEDPGDRRDGGEEPETVGLDASQAESVRRAVGREVFFIWGPPGTGKTHTLAALVEALFKADKRVLICSNTNRAVDQLLLKLCDRLTIEHPALRDGKVLRFGKIAHDGLRVRYEDYLVIGKIIGRLSVDLQSRREVIQVALLELEDGISRLEAVLVLFQAMYRGVTESEAGRQEVQRLVEVQQKAKSDHAAAVAAEERWRQTLAKRRSAGAILRAFMPSEARMLGNVQSAAATVTNSSHQMGVSAKAADEAAAALASLQTRVTDLERELAPHNRLELQRQRTLLEEKITPLREEFTRIQAQLADMERRLLADARVIGTTVTRTYLTAKDLGQFDAVIVDEASMVLLPAVYVAAGLSKGTVTISGDFNQLPPIVQSDQAAVREILGHDVFEESGVAGQCREKRLGHRVVMLDTQSRMVEPICDLIRERMGYRGLRTDLNRRTPPATPPPVAPAPIEGSLTIVDTSRLWPFESRNILGSRFNLMHAILVRNLCWHLGRCGFVTGKDSLGVCTPYAAQSKLESEMLADEEMSEFVTAGTVHSLQGDERRMMILDLPESIGSGFTIGRWLQADPPEDDGARLLNVAISRARDHLVVVANLTYLDAKLPSSSMLRGCLHAMQEAGRVVDGQDILRLRPFEEDLRRYGAATGIDWNFDKDGLFRQDGFEQGFQADVARAKKSVVIFSGFVTPRRAAAYADLFRRKIAEGVAIRCVTRSPGNNAGMDERETKRILDALEAIGVVVDTRWSIHEKVVIVDDETVWFGSLNPLSHTARTDEVMMRSVGKKYAARLAALLAVAPTSASEDGESVAVRKENPTCGCGGRMYYSRGRYGPFFKCEDCGKSKSLFRGRGR